MDDKWNVYINLLVDSQITLTIFKLQTARDVYFIKSCGPPTEKFAFRNPLKYYLSNYTRVRTQFTQLFTSAVRCQSAPGQLRIYTHITRT